MRLKLTIEYAGTRYSGWQIQKNARTVQGEIERAMREATGVGDFELYGSGRTDAGVHALAQVAHLDISTTLPPETLRRRINDALPSDIVHPASRAGATSLSRAARRRRPQLSLSGRPPAHRLCQAVRLVGQGGPRRSTRCARPRRAFVGFHDFRAFSDDDPSEKSTEVLVDALDMHEDEDLILFHIEGSHFIWKMVRRLVGVLVEVGRGGIAPDAVAHAAPGRRRQRGAPDGARVRAVSRTRLLPGRPARRARALDCRRHVDG